MRKLKLGHWFVLWLIGMLLLVVATQPASRPDKLDAIDFQTTESAELYFRNVRAYHYLHVQEGGDIFDVYRLKALSQQGGTPALPLAIYNNWRSNEAFLRLDTCFMHRGWLGLVRDSAQRMIEEPLPQMYNESQYTFAVRLYRSLRDEEPLALVRTEGDTLWLDADTRKHTKRVLTDYFKLVGRL